MNYDLIIFDLDGTAILSNKDALPSNELIDIVSNFTTSVKLSFATGRSWFHAQAPIKKLGIKNYGIISGGTQIIDPLSERLVWQLTIEDNAVDNLLEVANKLNKQISYVQGIKVSPPVFTSDIGKLSSVNTFYMLGIEQSELNITLAILNQIDNITPSITRSWMNKDIIDLHITPSMATKEHAVSQLQNILGISKERTIGIGDGHNDIHLFNAVGFRVAMGNAEDSLKKNADLIIDTVDNNGLAKYLSSMQ